jgi:tetratricopeptide (TPR) repeat protein
LNLPAAVLAASLLPGTPFLPQRQRPQDPARTAAIAALHRRAGSVSPGTPEAERIADELARIGSEDLEEGETGRAIELLSEAYALDEENGLILARLTLAYVRGGDFESARFYLKMAEERISRAPPEIYGLLGEIYYALNRLEDALLAWGEFARFGGQDPRILRRLVRARDELALTRGQRSLQLEHFSLFADPSVSDETLRRAGDELERAYGAQSAAFGIELPGSQVVVLYAGRAFFSLVAVPEWVSGLFDGKIRVSVEPRERAESPLAGVLAHELAHAMIRQSSHDRAPAWLHEGLAQWWEGKRLPRREIRSALGSHAAASLEALDAAFRGVLDRSSAQASYAQALSIVEYVMAARGSGALACLLARLRDGADFPEALEAETGWTDARLLAEWRRWAGVP